ncbi:MAG: DnaA/Hda family protein [Planctomycetota bacterium]
MSTRHDGINTRIADRLAQTVGQRRYELWIQPSVQLDYRDQDQTLYVAVPNRFVAEKIRSDFSDELRQAVRDEAGLGEAGDLRLDLCVEPDRFSRPTPSAGDRGLSDGEPHTVRRQPAAPSPTQSRDAKPAASFRHRFEDFVVGPCNELAYAAAVSLADADPADANPASAGPLFLHSDCGMGKTHLLQAACRRVRERQPQARVLYTTGEQFTNEYITAVRSNTLETFRRKMRRLDLLAVDDIGFFANKEKTQQEFLHSFDHIELAGSRVILASDSHPKLIQKFSDALVSRCMQGLVVQLQAPDTATRLALVNRLASNRGLVLPPQLDELIAAHAGRSVREIEGTLAHLHALATLAQPQGPTRLVNRALVEKLFAGQRQLAAKRPVRFTDIQDTVCEHLNVPIAQVAGSSRHRMVVLARAITVYLAKQMTTLSYPEIAAALNKPSHSTVVTAVQRMTRQLEDNQPMLLPGQPDATTPVQLVEDLRRRVLQSLAA